MYVVCLRCGTEFEYDWEAMRIGKRLETIPGNRVQRAVEILIGSSVSSEFQAIDPNLAS